MMKHASLPLQQLRSRRSGWSLILTIAALLVFGFTPPSHAVILDLSMMTCQEFLATDKDEIRIILAWLDGYYKDEQDPAILDTDTIVASENSINLTRRPQRIGT